jgi:hypothetical protein
LNYWSTLNPVYCSAADLSDPTTFATGPLGVANRTDQRGTRIPSTDEQRWHYCENCSLVSNRQFTITQAFDSDSVYIAGRVPYPPGYSAKFIDGISNNPLAKVMEIGKTPGDRALKVVQIGTTDQASQKSKPCVIICAGEQAHQPDGMWACQGCIEFLLGDSDKARALRDQFEFFIIPTLDPDGTAQTTTEFLGSFSTRLMNPTSIAYANWLQNRVLSGGRIDLVLELHSLQSGECEHLQRVDVTGLPEDRPPLIQAFQKLITQQFKANNLIVTQVNMRGGQHSPSRFSGWISKRFGALDIIYEMNAQAPSP